MDEIENSLIRHGNNNHHNHNIHKEHFKVNFGHPTSKDWFTPWTMNSDHGSMAFIYGPIS